MNKSSIHGLTLIELLICLVILAIFAALIVPAISRLATKNERLATESVIAEKIVTSLVVAGTDSREPIPCGSGWHYIGRNVTNIDGRNGIVHSLLSSETNFVSSHHTYVLGDQSDIDDSADKHIISVIVQNTGLTNGMFVRFRYKEVSK